jgi:hypothetical protein
MEAPYSQNRSDCHWHAGRAVPEFASRRGIKPRPTNPTPIATCRRFRISLYSTVHFIRHLAGNLGLVGTEFISVRERDRPTVARTGVATILDA